MEFSHLTDLCDVPMIPTYNNVVKRYSNGYHPSHHRNHEQDQDQNSYCSSNNGSPHNSCTCIICESRPHESCPCDVNLETGVGWSRANSSPDDETCNQRNQRKLQHSFSMPMCVNEFASDPQYFEHFTHRDKWPWDGKQCWLQICAW